MATLQELAKEALSYYKQRIIQRDGKEVWIWTHTGDAPEWVRKMTMEAHDGMLPDDWKYRFVVEALEAIAYSVEGYEDEAITELEADAYNNELLDWVSSSPIRMKYVDEAVEKIDEWPGSLAYALGMGQVEEKQQVGWIVLECLRNRSEIIDVGAGTTGEV